MTTGVLAAILVGGGIALVAVGIVLSSRHRQHELTEILDLPFRDLGPAPEVPEEAPRRDGPLGRAGELVGRLDSDGRLASMLDRARIPLRPGEYLILAVLTAASAGAALAFIGGQPVYAFIGVAAVGVLASSIPRRRIERRRKAIEAQLPEAISLIASSLSAGHTFLRAVQMMTSEADPPLSEEFETVLAETQLGRPLLDSLDRMANRLEIRDLSWVVQAIRIQQTVGGKLADLLFTLAGFIRAREEVRREVNVLTAEGRLSALVLAILPVFLLVAIQVLDPSYLKPFYRGWGYVWLGGCAASVAVGIVAITRMVRIDI